MFTDVSKCVPLKKPQSIPIAENQITEDNTVAVTVVISIFVTIFIIFIL
jgi:hypothetical protein